jgi:hypothetical protein
VVDKKPAESNGGFFDAKASDFVGTKGRQMEQGVGFWERNLNFFPGISRGDLGLVYAG